MKGVVLTAYGEPATGLEFRELPEPASSGAGRVLVGVEYAPINFSDILVAQGLYPLHSELPSVCSVRGPGKLEQGELVTIFPLPEQSDRALAPNVVGFRLLPIRRGK
ncbi:hypothetical protein M0D69_11955 [Caballeronia sp. SEWSISQ10-4 2]|uniref:hypothetical protein n=1 Tax=Caballeronia sp. SEWSISQ10-4 2 TaxID=2937438 RepID=UPI002651997F|nr:hypothetical protein [Caballeronia sp. SEWSISQ10-4 2]MDN7178722.1 hypothetical protein [Caballeronia sp. SEWSISQ10-4 2]